MRSARRCARLRRTAPRTIKALNYMATLTALERLVATDGRVTAKGLSDRVEQWRRAYLYTLYGQPVELSAGAPDRPAP